MRVDLPRDLLLAVVPNTRGIAFTYFEGPLSPVDWGLKETRGAGKNAQSLAALTEDRRMALFDAAALAMTHFSTRGLLSADQFSKGDR